MHVLGQSLEKKETSAPLSGVDRQRHPDSTEGDEQRSHPWREAAALVFPPILSELLWFRRLWSR
ncbi:MAG: hypothetical protein AAF889_00175 [Cyanobacteria bacterium P01_D01_bin.73]